MHILQMATKVATLSEVLTADLTLVGPLHRVLPKVVSKIAAFAEDGFAALILTPKVELGSLGLSIVNLNGFMPLFRYSLELLSKRGLSVYISRTLPRDSTILLHFGVSSLRDGLSTASTGLSRDKNLDGLFRY